MVDLKAEMLFHNKYLQHFIGQSCERAARAVMFYLTNPVCFFIVVVFRTWYKCAFLDFVTTFLRFYFLLLKCFTQIQPKTAQSVLL